jgi:RND family efflux transporter MFP subunit
LVRKALLSSALLVFSAGQPLHASAGREAPAPAPRSNSELRPQNRQPSSLQVPSDSRVDYVGVVFAYRAADITSEIGGVIKRSWVRLGQKVKAGQIIASLDTRALQRDLAIGEATLLAARAQETKASVDLDQAKQILARRNQVAWALSKEELERLTAAEKLAQANLEVASSERAEQEVRVQKVRDDLAKGEIRAPFGGRIGTLYQTEGALLASNTPVVRLVADDDLWIRFAIPPSEVAWAQPGRRAEIVVEDGNARFGAHLEHVAPEVDPAAGLIFVEAQLDPPGAQAGVRPGMVVRVRPSTN